MRRVQPPPHRPDAGSVPERETGSVPAWDGVGLLGFASADDWTNGLFDGPEGERAIYEDIPKFLDLGRGETLPASEFVYRDDG